MPSGLVRSSSFWSLGAKTYVAPTDGERAREEQRRVGVLAENLRIKDAREHTRHVREDQELRSRALYASRDAARVENWAERQDLRRARSWGNLGGATRPDLHHVALEQDLRRQRANLNIGRGELERARLHQEAALISRSRQNSYAREAVAAAALQDARLANASLGVGLGGGGLRGRARSFSDLRTPYGGDYGVGGLGFGPRLSPRLSPVLSPRLSPRLSPGRSFPLLAPHLSPRTSPLIAPRPIINNISYVDPAAHHHHHPPSPRASPRSVVINNFPSPHEQFLDGHHSSAHFGGSHSPRLGGGGGGGLIPRRASMDGLGYLDDFAGHGAHHSAGIMDPHGTGSGYDAPLFPSYGGRASPRLGGGSPRLGGGSPRMGGRAPLVEPEFVLSEEETEPGRMTLSELGEVRGQGTDGGGDPLEAALEDLTNNARMRGANGVLRLTVDQDDRGFVMAQGVAVILA